MHERGATGRRAAPPKHIAKGGISANAIPCFQYFVVAGLLLLVAVVWFHVQGDFNMVSLLTGAGGIGLGLVNLKAMEQPSVFQIRQREALPRLSLVVRRSQSVLTNANLDHRAPSGGNEVSPDNAAQAMEKAEIDPKVDRRCNRAWSRVCVMRTPDCIVSMVCCHTGEHKAAKSQAVGAIPHRQQVVSHPWGDVEWRCTPHRRKSLRTLLTSQFLTRMFARSAA